jgi:hypothetical protein
MHCRTMVQILSKLASAQSKVVNLKFFPFLVNIFDIWYVYTVNLVFHRLVQLNKGGKDTQSKPPLISL